jgi:hypothetical protein
MVVTRYYKGVNSKSNYSKLATDNIDLEETVNRNDSVPKPAQD